MLNDPVSLIPGPGATAAELRAAAEILAAWCRAAELQRSDAEMALRRIVYRRRRGLELIRDAEVLGLESIAMRNASALRGAGEDGEPIKTREGVLLGAARRAAGLLSRANPRDAERVLRRALSDINDTNGAGEAGAPDTL